ncbi:hypothetical protein [Brevibacillus choshinensis]|uniref:hypothetical protein n=1 Tax=Brevibacillus choshinensis TaxID=54911 RepID=UPI002E1B78C2|nr:hypothetical protein [Brevibacillus choshinensis]
MSGFHPFGHTFGAGGSAYGASSSPEDIRAILPIASGETVQVGDVGEVRKGKVFKSFQSLVTTKSAGDLGIGTVDSVYQLPVIAAIDEKRALMLITRWYAATSKYFLEAFIITDNGTSVSVKPFTNIIDMTGVNPSYADLTELDTGKFLFTYKDFQDSKYKGRVFEVVGDTVTLQNSFDISPGSVGNEYVSTCRLAKDKVLVSYNDIVRVLVFNGYSPTYYPEYDFMYDTQNTYICQERKLVAIDENHVVLYFTVNSTGSPFQMKPIKINDDLTCYTNLASTGGSMDGGYGYRYFGYGNTAVAFDGNKTAILAASSSTDKNTSVTLFVTEATNDGMTLTGKVVYYQVSSGTKIGSLAYIGKDSEGAYYFSAHFFAASTAYARIIRVAADYTQNTTPVMFTDVQVGTDAGAIASCNLDARRLICVSWYATGKKMYVSLHDTRLAMPDGVITQAVQGGANAEIQMMGVVRGLDSLQPGASYYGGADGELKTIPVSTTSVTAELNKLGAALSPTDLFIPNYKKR